MSQPARPSAFHEAQLAIWKAQLRAAFLISDAKHEVEIMEYRERRDDEVSTAEALNLIQKIRQEVSK